MVKIENEIVFFKGEELGKLVNAEIVFDCIVLNGVSFTIDENTALKSAWDKLYPNGKPVEVVEPEPQPSTEDLDKSEMTLKIIETLTELGVI